MYAFKKHIVGRDEKGWFVGELINDIIHKKHRLTFDKAVELITKWGKIDE